ncbi:MAG: lysylphosphatidylglycerol synthase transmembrane domain-containing protein [Acidimicrobiales bacterium]
MTPIEWRRRSPEDRATLVERIRYGPAGATQIGDLVRQGLIVALGLAGLSLLSPELLELVSAAPRLRTIRPQWFLVMVALECVSFACTWWLTRTVLPQVSWFVASTSQLVSNAVSRVVPGGAAFGGATLYRMLSISGVGAAEAGGALAATSILSTAALFAIPAVAFVLALLGAPIPEALWPAAVAGGVMFAVLVAIGSVGVGFDRPLLLTGRAIERAFAAVRGRFGRGPCLDPSDLVAERDRLAGVLGARWLRAVTAAAGNWAFDYLTLVAALYAVGADPRLSLVLLAYAGAAVLAMIPITPGGFGFVEVGLTYLLVLSGISTQNALLATLAYRIISLWLPIVSGLFAWAAYRHRFRSPFATEGGPDGGPDDTDGEPAAVSPPTAPTA